MATNNGTQKESTTVFNLIILDESGSMSCVREQTLSGCNETLNVIRSSAEQYKDKMRSFVSVYAFQDGGPVKSRYLIKNCKPEQVKDVTAEDYRPWGNTPLLDAVGSTLTELKTVAATHEDATGIVTIITDGYENSSTRYTPQDVARLISSLKEQGWTINLIGANVDVEMLGNQMGIDNRLAFTQTQAGTSAMFETFSKASAQRWDDMAIEAEMAMPERKATRLKKAKGFFGK